MASMSDNRRRLGRRYSRRTVLTAGLTAGLGIATACTTEAPKSALTPGPPLEVTVGPSPTPGLTGIAATLHTVQQRFPNPPPKPSWPPKYGGQLRTASPEYATLDPTFTGAYMIQGAVYNKLVQFRLGRLYPDLFYTPQMFGALAEKWEQPDPVTYIFHLRKDVKFHNIPPVNGRELDATDVKVSFDRYKEGIAAHHVRDIANTEAVDKSTVKATLKEPVGIFIEKISTGGNALWILPRELWEAQDGPREKAIGTGPFVLKEFSRASGWLLERNKEYFLKDDDGRQLPYLDSFKGIVMKDIATQMAAFRSKQIDLWEPFMIRQVDELMKTNPDMFVLRIPPRTGWRNHALMFRLDLKPFDDVRVRRAISLAIDRDNMIKTVYDGDAELMAPIPWAMGGKIDWPPKKEWLGPWFKYDPAQAKRLLAEAGYPNGFKTKATYVESIVTPQQDALLVIQRDLKQVGIELEIQQQESAAATKEWLAGSWEAIRFTSTPSGGTDWDVWVYWSHRSGSPTNNDKVNDPELDKLLDDARRTGDQAERARLDSKIWDRLCDQVYRTTTVVVYHYMVNHPYVENYTCNTYAWAPYYGSDQIPGVFLRDDAPGRKA